MPNFTAGTSFTDGVTNDVTAAKLNALVADAVPTSSLSLNSTTGTIANFTASTANITLGTIPTLTAGTTTGTAGIFTSGTIATLNSTTGTIPTLVATTLVTTGTGTAAAPAIIPTGDTNTGIFFPAADTIAFSEGGAEAMRIDSSGQVGIGTVSPINKLHLYNGTASVGATQLELEGRFNAYGAGINFSSRTSDGGTLVAMAKITADGEDAWNTTGTTTQDAGLRFSTTQNGTLAERVRIDSSGQVGIGTTSADSIFHIKDSVAVLTIEGTATSSASVQFKTNTINRYKIATPDSSADLAFYSSGTTERLRIDSSGNCSIGTATALSKLHIHGDLTLSNATTAVTASTSTITPPATVAGYLTVSINGTSRKIAYYAT